MITVRPIAAGAAVAPMTGAGAGGALTQERTPQLGLPNGARCLMNCKGEARQHPEEARIKLRLPHAVRRPLGDGGGERRLHWRPHGHRHAEGRFGSIVVLLIVSLIPPLATSVPSVLFD